MPTVPVVNTLRRPLIIDEKGHVLGAHTRGTVDTAEPRVQKALAAGHLLERQAAPAATPAPAVPAAAAETGSGDAPKLAKK